MLITILLLWIREECMHKFSPLIGICGFGFVGTAVYDSIKNKEDVVIFDPFKKPGNSRKSLLGCDFVFVCVPTPHNGKFDSTYVNETLRYFQEKEYNGVVILKSTIHPMYLKNTEGLNIVANPEFLNEYSALSDFRHQKVAILGGDMELCYKVKSFYEEHFTCKIDEYVMVDFDEALVFKYLRNIKIAYDVMFWEFVEQNAGNYRKFKKIMDKLPIDIKNIRADGLPGYGGHCLPKDIASFPQSILTKYLQVFNAEIRPF